MVLHTVVPSSAAPIGELSLAGHIQKQKASELHLTTYAVWSGYWAPSSTKKKCFALWHLRRFLAAAPYSTRCRLVVRVHGAWHFFGCVVHACQHQNSCHIHPLTRRHPPLRLHLLHLWSLASWASIHWYSVHGNSLASVQKKATRSLTLRWCGILPVVSLIFWLADGGPSSQHVSVIRIPHISPSTCWRLHWQHRLSFPSSVRQVFWACTSGQDLSPRSPASYGPMLLILSCMASVRPWRDGATHILKALVARCMQSFLRIRWCVHLVLFTCFSLFLYLHGRVWPASLLGNGIVRMSRSRTAILIQSATSVVFWPALYTRACSAIECNASECLLDRRTTRFSLSNLGSCQQPWLAICSAVAMHALDRLCIRQSGCIIHRLVSFCC